MVINNNQEAWISIGELNRNIKDTVREFEKVVTGQEINYTSDDPTKHASSEKMRTKLRALEQNQANAKAGMFMMTIAEEGIQEQLNILKTIRERAIQASDATTTDEDRVTIQKEITDGFRRIDELAAEVEHNGVHLLTGNVPIRDTTIGWQLLLTPQVLEDSDMHLIDDVYFELDGLSGPFDAFQRYHSVDTNETGLLGNNEIVNHSGGTDGTAAVFKMDFSGKTVNDLVGKAFSVYGVSATDGRSRTYYAVVDSSRGLGSNYYNSRGTTGFTCNFIDIAGMDMNGALNAIASTINSKQSNYTTAQVDGTSIKFTSKNMQSESNYATASSASTNSTYTGAVTGHEGAASTGLGLSGLRTSGGQNATYRTIHHDGYTDDTDRWHEPWDERVLDQPATYATLSFNASGAAADSGIRFNGMMIKFVTDPNDENYTKKVSAEGGVTKIGLGYTGSFYSNNFSISVNQGQFNIRAIGSGTGYNGYGISEGFDEVESNPGTLTSHGLGSLSFSTEQLVNGADGKRATYDIDLTEYATTDADKLEEFISTLKNHSLHLRYGSSSYATSYATQTIEFIDKQLGDDSMDSFKKIEGSTVVDLNDLRSSVGGSTTIADAFIGLMRSANSTIFSKVTDNGQTILRATSRAKGTFGNGDTLNTKENQFSQYTLDFTAWAQSYGGIASANPMRYLDGKGFRFYCATDTEHWFNFVFTSGEDEDDRPAGISGAHFETNPIDISSLNDDPRLNEPNGLAIVLAEIVFEQGNPYLEADNHNLYFSKEELAQGKLTIYDRRPFDVLLHPQDYRELREKGAKIGDGILDDVQKTTVTVPANQRQLAIQHTDYSSQYITLHIPQTTVNHLFGLDPDWPDYSRFNVTTQSGREYLLGRAYEAGTGVAHKSSGALDKAIEYLLDAATLVGAQNSLLRNVEMRIMENQMTETEAESRLRDADIAKAYVAFTKSNMLAKASHTMLAQANQRAYTVLDLLGRSLGSDGDEQKKSSTADKKSVDKSSDEKSADTSADKKSAADKKSTDKKIVAKSYVDKMDDDKKYFKADDDKKSSDKTDETEKNIFDEIDYGDKYPSDLARLLGQKSNSATKSSTSLRNFGTSNFAASQYIRNTGF